MLNIEEEIFQRCNFVKDKLMDYGFILVGNTYKYECLLGDFFAIVEVDDNKCHIKLIDKEFDDEYVSYRYENQNSLFVLNIRQQVIHLLKDIKDSCSTEYLFKSKQANQIAQYIETTYQCQPEFLWNNHPGYGVFRIPVQRKWFAVIMDVDGKAIDSNIGGHVEILNFKIDKTRRKEYLDIRGIYPSYHIADKESWVSIILNDSICLQQIKCWIDESYQSVV